MIKKLKNAATASLIMASLLPVHGALAFNDVEKDEIGTIVRQYLIQNPEILVEMQQVLEDREQIAETEARQTVLTQANDRIFNSPKDPVLGNPEGDITIVEFFDYNCGFCRRAHKDMVSLIENDPNIRFVVKEFPILGPDSQKAHTVSMAFQKLMPEQYGDYMDRLISDENRADEASAIALANEFGVEEATLRFEMENPEIIATVQQTYELANMLGITGTPSYIIGQEVLAGAIGIETLSAKVANLRECGTTEC